MKRQVKRIIYDIIGFSLLIIAPFLGAIPGPGGMILVFTGLGILATHNTWAERLLNYMRKNAESLLDIVFVPNKKAEALHDIFGVTLIAMALTIFYVYEGTLQYSLAGIMLSVGSFWLLYNRRRYKIFTKKIKK